MSSLFLRAARVYGFLSSQIDVFIWGMAVTFVDPCAGVALEEDRQISGGGFLLLWQMGDRDFHGWASLLCSALTLRAPLALP